MSSNTFKSTAVAAILVISVTGCGAIGDSLNAAVGYLTENEQELEEEPVITACPVPTRSTPPSATLKSVPGPDRQDRQNPGVGDLAWSCAGVLYIWDDGFKPYPDTNTWCRIQGTQPGTVEYRWLTPGKPCSEGLLQFITDEDVNGWSFWFDPKLNIWLAAQDGDLRVLHANAFCQPDDWRLIELESPSGGPLFEPDSLSCLQTHNRSNGLGPPADFSATKARAQNWAPDGTIQPVGWYNVAHAPVCEDVFQTRNCATMG